MDIKRLNKILEQSINEELTIDSNTKLPNFKGYLTLDTKLATFYRDNFPNDYKVVEDDLDKKATFADLKNALENGKDIPSYYGHDSVIRERMFQGLAKIENKDYDDIYDLWVKAREKSAEKRVNENFKIQHKKNKINEDVTREEIVEFVTDINDASESLKHELDKIVKRVQYRILENVSYSNQEAKDICHEIYTGLLSAKSLIGQLYYKVD